MADKSVRIERDSMGEMEVPSAALYGASTQRAVLNFPVSGMQMPRSFVKAVGVIKYAAAIANAELGLLAPELTEAIKEAAKEVASGEHYEHFVVDVFQTGSGTSTNMNANEVIANRALEILGHARGERGAVHPNDHVNMSQSSNDVIPTAIHISALLSVRETLLPNLEKLSEAFGKKSEQFKDVVKSGRTHLMDATPVTLGQEFGGYKAQIDAGIKRISDSLARVAELALGGTAVGTGLNTHPEFAKKAIAEISSFTGAEFQETKNHFAAQASQDPIVELSGQLKVLACSLMKIANDIRFLSSGPRCGLGELRLPEIQPGSSIMPAKVNPVICESVMMVAAQVVGNDACITTSGQHGNFELNVMLPVIATNILQSVELLANASDNFVNRCIDGIEANEERCREYADRSLATCTSLAPKIGYDVAANLSKRALKENRTVRELALEEKVLPEDELERVLDLMAMTKPGL